MENRNESTGQNVGVTIDTTSYAIAVSVDSEAAKEVGNLILHCQLCECSHGSYKTISSRLSFLFDFSVQKLRSRQVNMSVTSTTLWGITFLCTTGLTISKLPRFSDVSVMLGGPTPVPPGA